MKYHLDWLKAKYETEELLKYIFFWGHRPSRDGSISKSCFSQWWESDFTIDGINYASAEQWMMAEKARLFGDDENLAKILEATSPAAAKAFGRKVRHFESETWEKHRYEIVKKGNRHKFMQDAALQEFLINTKNRILVEASPTDRIWGIGLAADAAHIENPHTWKGLNLLGFALMEVREQIKESC